MPAGLLLRPVTQPSPWVGSGVTSLAEAKLGYQTSLSMRRGCVSTSKRAQALPRGRFAAGSRRIGRKPVTARLTARYASSLTVLLALVVALTTACSHAAASSGGAASMRLADCGGNPQTR